MELSSVEKMLKQSPSTSIIDQTLDSIKDIADKAIEKAPKALDYYPPVVAYKNREKLAKYYPPAMLVDYLSKKEEIPKVKPTEAGKYTVDAYKDIEGMLGETREVIPNEELVEVKKKEVKRHVSKVKEGFFERLGRIHAESVEKSFARKRETPKSFWDKLKNLVLDFGAYIKNVFNECTEWIKEYIGSWSNLKARLGMESFYWMYKVSPDLAKKTLKWGVSEYTEDLPKELQTDFNKIVDSGLEVYDSYTDDKRSKLINSGWNSIYYFWSENPEDLKPDDLPVIGRTLVDVLYNLKKKATSQKDFEKILTNFYKAIEMMNKKEGKNNPALEKLEKIIQFDKDDVSEILAKFLYPDKDLYKDEGFFDDLTGDIKDIYKWITSPVDTAVEKGKGKLDELFEDAGKYWAKGKKAVGFAVSDEFTGLVEVISKKGVGIEALSHIIYNFKQEDVLNFVQAYLEVKNARLIKEKMEREGKEKKEKSKEKEDEKDSLITKLFSGGNVKKLITPLASRLFK